MQAIPIAHAVTIAATATFQVAKSRRTLRSEAGKSNRSRTRPVAANRAVACGMSSSSTMPHGSASDQGRCGPSFDMEQRVRRVPQRGRAERGRQQGGKQRERDGEEGDRERRARAVQDEAPKLVPARRPIQRRRAGSPRGRNGVAKQRDESDRQKEHQHEPDRPRRVPPAAKRPGKRSADSRFGRAARDHGLSFGYSAVPVRIPH